MKKATGISPDLRLIVFYMKPISSFPFLQQRRNHHHSWWETAGCWVRIIADLNKHGRHPHYPSHTEWGYKNDNIHAAYPYYPPIQPLIPAF